MVSAIISIIEKLAKIYDCLISTLRLWRDWLWLAGYWLKIVNWWRYDWQRSNIRCLQQLEIFSTKIKENFYWHKTLGRKSILMQIMTDSSISLKKNRKHNFWKKKKTRFVPLINWKIKENPRTTRKCSLNKLAVNNFNCSAQLTDLKLLVQI